MKKLSTVDFDDQQEINTGSVVECFQYIQRRYNEGAYSNEHHHKMRGVYSYYLLDHPDFLKAQRMEKRIIKYNKKSLKKLKSGSQSSLHSAMKVVNSENIHKRLGSHFVMNKSERLV